MHAAASSSPDVHTEDGLEHSNAARTLRPLLTAIEMVFGSAAALSATFGYRVRHLQSITQAQTNVAISLDLPQITQDHAALPVCPRHGQGSGALMGIVCL